MHAQKKFWCRCSQTKREAGNTDEPHAPDYFCPHCGQETNEHSPSAREFVYSVVALHAVYASAWWATVLKGLLIGFAYAVSLLMATILMASGPS
jgi:hypothetical protein